MENEETKTAVQAENLTSETNNELPKEKAGCWGIGVSVLFPLIGIIIYCVKKNEVENPSAYLIAAVIGMAINGIFMAIGA